jgi:lysophospholipase L1-like esterase
VIKVHASKRLLLVIACLFIAARVTIAEIPAAPDHWVGSWYASPVGNFASSPDAPAPFADGTLRTVVQLTVGGDRLRVRLSNLYGRTALKIGAARVAATAVGKELTFGGLAAASLAPGAIVVSDPVDLATFAGEKVAVSVFYPKRLPRKMTLHKGAAESDTLSPGNTVRDTSPPPAAKPLSVTRFLTGVDVERNNPAGAIVAIGDSITDGGSRNWPALLAQRLAKAGKSYGVINAGISGNRLLCSVDGAWGRMDSAGDRFERDVLNQPGVRYVILYEGINDIGLSALGVASAPDVTQLLGVSDPPTASMLEAAIRTLARRARRRGLRIYVATLGPFEGATRPRYYSAEKDQVRQALNEWIRTSTEIDGYLEFEHALADPVNPNRMNRDFDTGDRLHPNDAGQVALSESIDLALFQ